MTAMKGYPQLALLKMPKMAWLWPPHPSLMATPSLKKLARRYCRECQGAACLMLPLVASMTVSSDAGQGLLEICLAWQHGGLPV